MIRSSDFRKVEKAAAKVAASHEALEESMREAHAAGLSLRLIAHAAGMSHESVRRILSRA